MQSSKNVVAGYYRLSLEDDNIQGDSSSIITQREIIQKYIRSNEQLVDYEFLEFYDDGYSGANMKRPGITKLLDLVKQQKVSCIIVKDFSRFSRDYIELGSYMEQIFPFTGVRFISVSDHYDSIDYAGKTSDLDVEFKGLIADFYCKEISQKVKNAYKQKWEQGKRIPGNSPFGYKTDPNDRYGLVIEPEEAKIVRRIFKMKLDGVRTIDMCKTFNEEGVLTAGEYKKLRRGISEDKIREEKKKWAKYSIRNVLINRTYIGVMEYGKYYTTEIRGHSKNKNKEDWGAVENHHKPIIGAEDFEKVQSLLTKTAPVKGSVISENLKGKLVCGNCGHKLQMRRNKNGGSIYCVTRFIVDNHECIRGTVQIKEIESLLLESIRMQISNLLDVNVIRKEIMQKHDETLKELRIILQSYIKKEKELIVLQTNIYEQYRSGALSREAFQVLRRTNEESALLLQAQKETAKVKLNKISMIETEDAMSIEQIMEYAHMEKLNRDMMDTFVEEVRFYNDRRMVIHWKFNGKSSTQILSQQCNSISYHL